MRPENRKMKIFLSLHGVNATPKWLKAGSLKRTWRISNPKIKWSTDLANHLNSIGFRDFNNKPLGEFSGNGGVFQVFVRGNETLLEEVA